MIPKWPQGEGLETLDYSMPRKARLIPIMIFVGRLINYMEDNHEYPLNSGLVGYNSRGQVSR